MRRARARTRSVAGLALVALASAALPARAAPPNATVVEYYRSEVDHYFMTASPREQALLDDGTLPGWQRTGATFFAWTDPALAPSTAHPVCRFYGRPEAGLDSHFYSAFADECDAVRIRFGASWTLESPNVFYIDAPDRTTGSCTPGNDPVYRLYDNRADANHRFVVSLELRATMLARGWVAEGYGPDAVVMCAPAALSSADDRPLVDAASYSTLAARSLASAADAVAVTHHSAIVGSTTIHYTASAGHLAAGSAGGAQASFFYVAYTADGQDAATRPVTFFYNGGPGSASAWLHLGSFGPKRLATGDPSTAAPAPFPLVDNAETLLDATDMVFVDAVGSGLSEAIAPNVNGAYWSVDADALAFRDFVVRYIDANARAASPKFLFGESYGTTRTAVLARELETAGVALTGIVLQSSVLDYNSNCGVVGANVASCAGYLPTYGSVGAYYGLTRPTPTDITAFRRNVESFAATTYAPAVTTVLNGSASIDASLVDMLSALTGVTPDVWRSSFNLDPDTFQLRLVPGTLIGRYDARVSAPFGSALASEGDPSSTFITPSFAQAITAYLQGELKYTFFSPYVLLSNAIETWRFDHDGRALPDTIPDLAAALALDPAMKVLSLNGYHDLATPYLQTMLDLGRLGANPSVQVRTYAGGHMTYLDDVSRPLESADIRALVRAVTPAQ